MKVRIEQEYCTGDGICEEICPEVFEVREDGLAYVRIEGEIPADFCDSVEEAADQCPSQAIILEK